MSYHVQVAKLFFRREDSLFRIREAEQLHGLWKRVAWFFVFSMLLFGFLAWKGLGMDPISVIATELSFAEYESLKLFFLLGRAIFGILLALAILFFTPLVFWIFTDIPYRKLVTVQLNVLLVMFIERLTWVFFIHYIGLDWYVSPLSFGIITSYITQIDWWIYFFGAFSIFQIWIMWFQWKAITDFSEMAKWKAWMLVILLHISYWAVAATLAIYDLQLL
ncbi:hypothetical protein [Pontibacillus sp. HMF3514]|uniref:hypothetical protein n=1 Tax=Pontibacillus sp. HMF3514 TaxID=2692425 RepID=UPI001320109B|nr:hypothetical protein [Pontibacillus sp. HMF3514]QHE53629.1 hypothetical protein GS400_17115 [Pontibacillus sp. HMF3514]